MSSYIKQYPLDSVCMQGAAEMAQMEHIINVYASKAAKGSIAEFLGYCEVSAREANYRLTEGLWLVSQNGTPVDLLHFDQSKSSQVVECV